MSLKFTWDKPFRIRKIRGRWRVYCAQHPQQRGLHRSDEDEYIIECRAFEQAFRFLEIHVYTAPHRYHP